MQDLNLTIIHGHVTRDAELKYTPSGTAVATFGVACNGYKKDSVSFFEVQIWNKYAEAMNQYITKGKEIVVKGRHEQSFWQAQDGTKRNKWVLTAEMINLCGGGPKTQNNGARPASQAQRQADPTFEDSFGGGPFDENGFGQ